ncbi:hypothetical protein [Streptacidiphilus sp. PAMC 29251]
MKRRSALLAAATGTTSTLVALTLLLPVAAHATDTPTADGPSVEELGYLKTDHGIVLRGTAASTAAKMNLIVERAYPTGGVAPAVTFTITQTAADGSWQTTTPLNLPDGDYWLSSQAFDKDGNPGLVGSIGGLPMAFKPQPVFHDTVFSPGPLTYMSPTETVTGTLTTYDPESGDTGTPWTGPITVQATAGNPQDGGNVAGTQAIAANGSYRIDFQPQPNTSGDEPVSVQAILPGIPCPGCVPDAVTGPTTTVPIQRNQPTRLLLDHPTNTGLTAGTRTTVTGTVQYQDSTGWHPVPQAWVFLGGDGTWSATQTLTDADGRFTIPLTIPTTPTSWPVYVVNNGSTSKYLTSAQASYAITSVNQQPTLTLAGVSLDAHSSLTFTPAAHSTNNVLPTGHTYLQQSPDGHTGWTTIATLPASTTTPTRHTLRVNNPHGYWRLTSPATTGYAAATSNTIHTFRYQTKLTGGPTTTHAHIDQHVTFSGHLQQQGYGPWTNTTGATVQIVFRPHGTNHYYTMATAHTNSQGHFTTTAKITGGGTWYLYYQTPDQKHLDATTTGTYIHLN